MNKFTLPLVGAGVIGGTAGIFGVYKLTSGRDTVASTLKASLLSFKGNENAKEWVYRATEVGSADQSSLSPDLFNLRVGSTISAEKLRNWCKSKSEKEVSGMDAILLSNIKTYCVYKMQDKLSNVIGEQGPWVNANNFLYNKPIGDLSSDMKKVKEAFGQTLQGDADALKKWCMTVYEEMFENNQRYKDASEYCVNNKG